MRNLSEDQATQMMGIGYLGEVRQGPDGNLYQYVQGVDGLGNPIGAWWKRLVRRALPLARQFAPFIPGGAAALTAVTPFLKQAGVEGSEELGAFHGLAAGEELQGISDDAMTQLMGVGYLGEVRQGPDGNLYQYVQGVNGLGNPIGGFWSRMKRGLKAVHSLAQRGASFIPGPYGAAIATGLKLATPLLQKAGVAGHDGMGALYQAPDGSLYQGVSENEALQGLDDDAELRGLEADDELHGLNDDPELRGFDEGEELRGLNDDMELRGLDDSEDLRGFDAELEMQGMEGYVRQDGVSGLEAFVPQEPPQTRWHVVPGQTPEVWKPLW